MCHFSVRSFEFTSELAIFDLCGVELYHGWLPDPQDVDTHETVSPLSYNQLVEKSLEQSADIAKMKNSELCDASWLYVYTLMVLTAILCSDFVEQTANQLTYHGLCRLHATITDQQLCVFFRNNHFSTLYKHQVLWGVCCHYFISSTCEQLHNTVRRHSPDIYMYTWHQRPGLSLNTPNLSV